MELPLLLTLFAIFFIVIFFNRCKEHFGEGALTQLFAKGPEDSYLTYDTDKYVPEYWGGIAPWRYSLWNAPTRLSSYYYPFYSLPYNNAYMRYRW